MAIAIFHPRLFFVPLIIVHYFRLTYFTVCPANRTRLILYQSNLFRTYAKEDGQLSRFSHLFLVSQQFRRVLFLDKRAFVHEVGQGLIVNRCKITQLDNIHAPLSGFAAGHVRLWLVQQLSNLHLSQSSCLACSPEPSEKFSIPCLIGVAPFFLTPKLRC